MDIILLSCSILSGCFILSILFQTLFPSSPKSKDGKQFPPGPKPLPIVGNLFELGDKPHRSLTKLSDVYGPIMRLKLGYMTTVVISSSATAKQIFQTHDQIFASRPIPDATNADNHSKYGMPWLPVSTFWRTLRKISNSHLFAAKVLDGNNMKLRHEKVQELLTLISKFAETGKAIDIGSAAFQAMLNLLTTTFFSVDLNDLSPDAARELKDTVWNVMVEMGKPNLSDFFPLLKTFDPQGIRRRATVNIRKFTTFLDGVIEQRLKQREANASNPTEIKDCDTFDTLLNMMLASGDISSKEDQRDTHKITHFLLDLLLAGIETVSSALEWGMAELLHSPETMLKARAEVRQVIGKGNQVKETDVARLPYIQAVVKETLRLHPSLPVIPRKAEVDVEVSGYHVPKDAQILINAWAVGRDSSVWENPYKFMPERFIESNVDIGGRNFEFIPFGGGRRICPGLPLATRMLNFMMASLLNSFDWKLEDGVTPETMNMDDKAGLTVQMLHPLRIHPTAVN